MLAVAFQCRAQEPQAPQRTPATKQGVTGVVRGVSPSPSIGTNQTTKPALGLKQLACPSGYVLAAGFLQSVSRTVCEIDHRLSNAACTADADHYLCGRGGSECCVASTNNPCFAGAYACAANGGSGPLTACCLSGP